MSAISKPPAQAATGKWRFVPKEEALKRMQKNEGMAEIVASLPRNPLPDAFIVEPTNSEPEALEDPAQGNRRLAQGGACPARFGLGQTL
jgi:cell division protein FtsX